MPEPHSIVTSADRAELLRHGIVIIEADTAEARVGVTGYCAERVREIAGRQLGDAVDVDVLGDLPRRLEPRVCVGYMEREPGRLQLRLVLGVGDHVDDIVVAEDEHVVVAFATVCTPNAHERGPECEVPCHVYLERPLGERTVIDGTSGRAVPFIERLRDTQPARPLSCGGARISRCTVESGPPGTRHICVGTGEQPRVILMTGTRPAGRTIAYPTSDVARAYGAGVDHETAAPAEAYPQFPAWRGARPERWAGLPWA